MVGVLPTSFISGYRFFSLEIIAPCQKEERLIPHYLYLIIIGLIPDLRFFFLHFIGSIVQPYRRIVLMRRILVILGASASVYIQILLL